MKKYLLFIFTSLFITMQAFAQENNDADSAESKEKKVSLEEKLGNIKKKKVKIYSFNPVKNKEGFITLIEFNDLNCDECLKESKKIYDTILPENIKSIKIIYKHINSNPNTLVNKNALYGLLAAEFNKFWEFKSSILTTKYNTEEDVLRYFISINLDKNKLQNKLKEFSSEFYYYIDSDNMEANNLEITQAPTFFIDGYKLNEDILLEELNEYIKLKVTEHDNKVYKENNKYKMGRF